MYLDNNYQFSKFNANKPDACFSGTDSDLILWLGRIHKSDAFFRCGFIFTERDFVRSAARLHMHGLEKNAVYILIPFIMVGGKPALGLSLAACDSMFEWGKEAGFAFTCIVTDI